MQSWIFSDEIYSEQYYALYAQLLEQVDIQAIIVHAYELIASYVEKTLLLSALTRSSKPV